MMLWSSFTSGSGVAYQCRNGANLKTIFLTSCLRHFPHRFSA